MSDGPDMEMRDPNNLNDHVKQLTCFWPPNNASQRCKKEEIPDADLWTKYEIKVLAYTGASARILNKSKEHEIEEAIAEVLRNAPHRPGGLKFTVLFEDVFGEPEGVRSLDCVWRNSFRCFTGAKRCCYVFLTTLCAIPIALCWGFKFACISFCHIWQVAPMLRVCQINIGCIQKMYSFIVNCACAPCCEAFALFFSKISVRSG